jgi:hypothetical protein
MPEMFHCGLCGIESGEESGSLGRPAPAVENRVGRVELAVTLVSEEDPPMVAVDQQIAG